MAATPDRRRTIPKPILLASAVLFALVVGLPAAHFIRKAGKRPRLAPYGLQLVDDAGRALGKAHGPLKIVLDPFTVYRLAPNQKTRRVTVNGHGGRGPDASHGPVVAFLGGSACFGQELANDGEVFTGALQRNLPDRRWLNFGCPGYYSGQEVSFYLHQLRELAPAVVVSVGGWNDLFGAIQGPPRRPGMEGFNETFFEVRDRLCDFQAGGRGASIPPPDTSRDEAFERACRTYLANMLDLSRLARARGAAFLWVVQPELGAKEHPGQFERDLLATWERHYRYSPTVFTRRFAELRRRAKQAAREHAVPFLDVNECDAWRSEEEVVLFADPVHPNARGHQLLADLLGRAVNGVTAARATEAAN